MGRIFKYEFRRRLNMIIILSGIMLVLCIGTLIMLSMSNLNLFDNPSLPQFWWVTITIVTCSVLPIVMFATCSNGHIADLLYKDTNYLMLTIPIRSEFILAGRMLVGFLEFAIYSVIAFVFFVLFSASSLITNAMPNKLFIEALGLICKNIFVNNALPVLYFILWVVTAFFLVGSLFICVNALTRSFIRRKKLAEIIAAVFFILAMSQIIRAGAYLSEKFNLVQYVTISQEWYDTGIANRVGEIPIHLVTVIFMLVLASVAFWFGSWLIRKKVEL